MQNNKLDQMPVKNPYKTSENFAKNNFIFEINEDEFPISAYNAIQGSRRLVREKVLQILVSHHLSNTPINKLFKYIFFRNYKQDADKNNKQNRLLSRDEVKELDADIGINWRESDIIFAKTLINCAIKSEDYVTQTLKDISKNWDYERISVVDRILIIIAVAEFIYFENIPVKVSMNEAIDISKSYSTDKSTQFINGILEKIFISLTEEKKITKNKEFDNVKDKI